MYDLKNQRQIPIIKSCSVFFKKRLFNGMFLLLTQKCLYISCFKCYNMRIESQTHLCITNQAGSKKGKLYSLVQCSSTGTSIPVNKAVKLISYTLLNTDKM